MQKIGIVCANNIDLHQENGIKIEKKEKKIASV